MEMDFFENGPSNELNGGFVPNPFDDDVFDLPNMGTAPISTNSNFAPPQPVEQGLEDLFGDDEDEPMRPASEAEEEEEELDEEEVSRRKKLEYEEDEDPSNLTTTNESIASINLANYAMPPAGKVWHARLPNFLELNSKPFSEESWKSDQFELEKQRAVEDAERKEDEGEGKKEKAIIPDENVIRWRWGMDDYGEPIKESNSRIVQWSDGSLSLQVGTELFDITAAIDHSATLPTNTAGYVAPKEIKSEFGVVTSAAPDLSTFDPARSHGLTYITANHEYTELIEAQASVHGTLTFRPTTLQSKTHRLLAANIAGRNAKMKAMKQTLTEQDPERQKAALEKAEIDNAKKAARAATKASGGSKKRVKKDVQFYGGSDDDQSEEEEEEDGYDGRERRSNPRRGRNGPLAQNQDSENEFENDDFVVNSSDDGTKPENARSRNKRNNGREEEDDIDDLDKMLDRNASKKIEDRRAKRMGEAGEEEPVQKPSRRLVIESDEDE